MYVKGIVTAQPVLKFMLATGLVAFLGFCYITVYPLIEHTLGISELSADDATFIFNVADYGTTGTLAALSDDHLTPLDRPPLDLIVGFAIDPNSVGRYSDIGYVKFIYHVGIIGTSMIVFLHLRMMTLAFASIRKKRIAVDERLLNYFLVWLIGSGLLFNYKSLELYSRGTGDLIFIIFIFLGAGWVRCRFKNGVSNA